VVQQNDRMIGIIGDRAGQLGGNGEYWMGRLRVACILAVIIFS
jgi:hypothetical protein